MLYFIAVTGFSMFLMHPVCLAISLAGGVAYGVILKGRKALRFQLICVLPVMIFSAVINPLFNHRGNTILTYFPGGNPLTMESVLYGLAAAVMIASVICWFMCFNEIMSCDKIIFLFGKVLPALSLVISIIIRFVPEFKRQIRLTGEAVMSLGQDKDRRSLKDKIHCGIRIMSVMVVWSMENSLITAESMKSRGYGLPDRSFYSVYSGDKRDKTAIICIMVLSAVIIGGIVSGVTAFSFFPELKVNGTGVKGAVVFTAYFVLCIMPLLIELREVRRWKALQRKG